MANRIPKPRIIYSNYDLLEQYPDEEIIETLIAMEYEEDEITDEMISRERYFIDEVIWEEERERLEEFFCNGKWILFGEFGGWDRIYKAGVIDTFNNFFYEAIKDCPYYKIYDENGHLYLTCTHHDGTCHYEIKKVTDNGIQYLENWENNWKDKRTKEYVHTQIFNRYSRLPRFAEKVYGCKRVEYQPVTKEALIDRLNNQAKSFYS